MTKNGDARRIQSGRPSRSLGRATRILIALSLASASPAAASIPIGVFLWYSQQAEAPTSADCDTLVRRLKPSREKAEAWLWGRAPFGSELEFYLFVSEDRIEPTYAAEGDYDTGTVRLGPTVGDTTPFELVPDDHPLLTIKGSITAPAQSRVVAVTLRDVPTTNGKSDRTTYFCRFDDAETET